MTSFKLPVISVSTIICQIANFIITRYRLTIVHGIIFWSRDFATTLPELYVSMCTNW